MMYFKLIYIHIHILCSLFSFFINEKIRHISIYAVNSYFQSVQLLNKTKILLHIEKKNLILLFKFMYCNDCFRLIIRKYILIISILHHHQTIMNIILSPLFVFYYDFFLSLSTLHFRFLVMIFFQITFFVLLLHFYFTHIYIPIVD